MKQSSETKTAERQDAVVTARLQAVTGEQISFSFSKVSQFDLNEVSKDIPYWPFLVNSYFIADEIDIAVKLPKDKIIPVGTIIKIYNRLSDFTDLEAETTEYREIETKTNNGSDSHDLLARTMGLKIMLQAGGRPHTRIRYRQAVEVILDYGDHKENLICPVNGTTAFHMCLYDARYDQTEK